MVIMYIKNIQTVAEHVMKLNLVRRTLPRIWSWEQSLPYARDQNKRGSPKKAWEITISTAERASQGRPTLVATSIRHPQGVFSKFLFGSSITADLSFKQRLYFFKVGYKSHIVLWFPMYVSGLPVCVLRSSILQVR